LYQLRRRAARQWVSRRALCGHLDMTRQAVTQHLGVLEAANLVATVRHGRESCISRIHQVAQ
jgi:DNA-binding transcriptional ArsR family regulator